MRTLFLFDYGRANAILAVTREQTLIEGSAEPGLPRQDSAFDPLYANPGPIRRIAIETDPGAPAKFLRLTLHNRCVVRVVPSGSRAGPVPTKLSSQT
jgi:hypothetical protein